MDVFRSALSLVIHKEGNVSEADIDELIGRYSANKGITLDKARYTQAVQAATEHYEERERLFVCVESRCMKNMIIAPSQRNAELIGSMLGCDVEMTGCQYKCELGPTLMLKTPGKCITFSGCSSEEAWNDALIQCATILSTNA